MVRSYDISKLVLVFIYSVKLVDGLILCLMSHENDSPPDPYDTSLKILS